jgi:hypothetical protein
MGEKTWHHQQRDCIAPKTPVFVAEYRPKGPNRCSVAMSILKELHRRNVFRVAALYLVVAWLILKSTHVMIDLAGLAPWVRYACEIVLAIMLPVVLWFAWTYDITPQGLRRQSEVGTDKSVTSLIGRKIDCAILITIIIGIAVFLLDRANL